MVDIARHRPTEDTETVECRQPHLGIGLPSQILESLVEHIGHRITIDRVSQQPSPHHGLPLGFPRPTPGFAGAEVRGLFQESFGEPECFERLGHGDVGRIDCFDSVTEIGGEAVVPIPRVGIEGIPRPPRLIRVEIQSAESMQNLGEELLIVLSPGASFDSTAGIHSPPVDAAVRQGDEVAAAHLDQRGAGPIGQGLIFRPGVR